MTLYCPFCHTPLWLIEDLHNYRGINQIEFECTLCNEYFLYPLDQKNLIIEKKS
jgi:hypothetical protein